jgi:cell division protein FtsN
MKLSQGGGFVLGMVAGLLVGLALALGVALYITKAPVPFINKVPQRTAEHDRAEAERNKQWNPNAPLGSKSGPLGVALPEPDSAASSAGVGVLPAPAAVAAPASAVAPAVAPARDPAAILAGAPVAPPKATQAPLPTAAAASAAAPRSTAPPLEAFVYFVQTGAFTRHDDAEQQRAKLSLMGLTAKITEREQSGRTVYRVRVGPYPARGEADTLMQKLQEQAIEAQIVRVERP